MEKIGLHSDFTKKKDVFLKFMGRPRENWSERLPTTCDNNLPTFSCFWAQDDKIEALFNQKAGLHKSFCPPSQKMYFVFSVLCHYMLDWSANFLYIEKARWPIFSLMYLYSPLSPTHSCASHLRHFPSQHCVKSVLSKLCSLYACEINKLLLLTLTCCFCL